MTDRHDPQWDLDDDELVRAALMSLMDDVRAEPLPEPATIRARAESGSREAAGGTVVDLASRRRRSFTAIAGIAAAAVVATSVALLVQDGDPTAPAGTTSQSSATPQVTMLDSREWSGALGLDVSATTDTSSPNGMCFQTPQTDTWERQVSTLADGRVVAGQWIGTAKGAAAAPTQAVDEAVARCESTYPVQTSVLRNKAGGVRYRFWHARGSDGTYWWVEATRGNTVTFMSIAELDGMTYTVEEMERIGAGALGEAELATD